ncbi:hypothetical protein GBA52_010369 [Prunus armeniaca]|nr:hypothetical protein GBA52_010369 [Prunus armeniaca]
MAPKKSKAPKVSADAPDWIFGRGVAEYVKEFQVDEMMPKYKDKWMQNGLGNDALEFLEDDVPAIALAINPLSSLKKRGLHQAPRHWKDMSNSRAIIHANMRVSCLSSKDLFFGKVHINKKFQYTVEAYNPQFGSRQFRLVQAIPELSNSSVNKGSSWRDMSMTPSEVKAVVLLAPRICQTPLYLSLQRLPFCSVDDKIGRSVYDEEVKASLEDGETVLGEPSGPEETGKAPTKASISFC